MKALDRLRYQVPFSNYLRLKRITKSFGSAENLSIFGILTFIIIPIWKISVNPDPAKQAQKVIFSR